MHSIASSTDPSIDPFVQAIQKALELEQQGKIKQAVTEAKRLWQQRRDHPEAIKAALIWARAEGDNADAIYALSMCYLLQGNFQQAIQGLTIATKMNSKHDEAFAALAIALRATGDLPSALATTSYALQLNPNNINAITNKLDTLYDQGNFDEALLIAKGASQKFPQEAGLHSNAARLYSKVGDLDEAMKHHRRVIQLQPNNSGLRVNYLGYLNANHRTEEMLQQLEESYKIFSKDISAQRIHPLAWMQVKYMHALAHETKIDPTDRLLNMRDMESPALDNPHLKCVDRTKPVWLYEAKDLRCYSNDWAYFDENDLFMNQKVTGRFFVFLMSYGVKDRAYVQDHYPEYTIDEPCLLLGGIDNYYHWVIDYLPRLSVLDYYPELKNLPIYITEKTTPFMLQSLAAVGIDPARIKTVPTNHTAILKQGYIAHIPGRPMHPNGEPVWMKANPNPFPLQWLREKLLPLVAQDQTKKRYFISRSAAQFRRCINEAELLNIAKRYGFEIMENEGKAFMDQIAFYAHADSVIGPHGAGFTNCVFVPKRAKIMELFPKNRTLDFYSTIAQALDQDYAKIEGPIQRTFQDKSADFGDFLIDQDEFTAQLDRFFG